MRILVTAGNTLALIDSVRCLTNVFTGRTGAAIAREAYARGHEVTLVTSHPEAIPPGQERFEPSPERWAVEPYRTFEDLQGLMAGRIPGGDFGAIVHCAAVSDYLSAGVYAPAPGTHFDVVKQAWQAGPGRAPTLVDRGAGKVKSDQPELWLRLVRAPKLVDCIRGDWGYRGILVKFKLEVGIDDAALLEVAERSRVQSAADLMVANTLEGAGTYAFVGPLAGGYERVERGRLAGRLLDVVEGVQRERGRG